MWVPFLLSSYHEKSFSLDLESQGTVGSPCPALSQFLVIAAGGWGGSREAGTRGWGRAVPLLSPLAGVSPQSAVILNKPFTTHWSWLPYFASWEGAHHSLWATGASWEYPRQGVHLEQAGCSLWTRIWVARLREGSDSKSHLVFSASSRPP